jgi:hypothetical protein
MKVNLFFLVLSLGMATAYLTYRIGFAMPVELVLGALAIMALITLGPVILLGPLKINPSFAGRAINLLTLPIIILIFLFSYLPDLGLPFLYCLSPIVIMLALWNIRAKLSWKGTVVGALALIGIGGLFVVVNLYRFHPPFSSELAYYGQLHRDTLHHFAITQMQKNFGYPSIGIDGVLPMHYHSGSHFLLARLSSLVRGEIPSTYPIFAHIILVPLLIRSLVSVSMDYSNAVNHKLHYLAPIICPVLLLVLFGGLEWDSYLHSISYLCSLLLLLTTVPVLLELQRLETQSPRKGELGIWLLFLAIVQVITFCKVSTGFIVSIFSAYVVLRSRKALWFRAIFLGTVALLFVILYARVHFGGPELTFNLFGQALNRFIYKGNYVFFLLINIFTITYVYFRLRSVGVTSFEDLLAALRARKIVDAEALVLVSGLGMSTWPFFNKWPAAYYFDNIQMWIALPLVAGSLLGGNSLLREHARTDWKLSQPGWRELVIILLLGPALLGTSRYIHEGIVGSARSAQLVREVNFGFKANRAWLVDPILRARIIDPGVVEPSAGREIVEKVMNLREKYGRSVAVYVPQSNSEYWDLYEDCWSKPLFIPAMTGVPLVDGLPPVKCNDNPRLYHVYGFQDYRKRGSDDRLAPDKLCRAALARGFAFVYSYASITRPEGNELYSCDEMRLGKEKDDLASLVFRE